MGLLVECIPDICHGQTICHVEKFVHMTSCHGDEFSTLSCGKNSPHEKCEENL